MFQQVMDTMLGGFDFTFAHLDDIVFSSKMKELHRQRLNKGFAQIREYGVGACILHKIPIGTKKPIAHASRTLLPADKYYSQFEKEALGIIFAVTKFHRYLHGRFFTLQTDHKPPITIFGSKKGLPIYTANRLLRWGTI